MTKNELPKSTNFKSADVDIGFCPKAPSFARIINAVTIRLTVIVLLLVAFAMTLGCGNAGKKTIAVGVAMPTQTRQRWNQDGANLERKLQSQGYAVDLEYANNEPDLQIAQINQMIETGCKVIIIGSVDGYVLGDVLDRAKDKGVTVIAYDRMIMNTDAVDYYATFDNLAVGTIQGEYIEEKLGLKNGNGPYNMEITAGSLDDSNTIYYFEGAMNVLRPYIANGQLVVRSGQTAMQQCAIPHWKEHIAEARMYDILTNYYRDAHLDVALCPNDSTAIGAIGALKAAGYHTADKKMPLITGQDADRKNVRAILADEQTMSIFKDTRNLADQVVKMVNSIIAGKMPETNDLGNYYNGVKVVPSFLVRPQFVDKDNYFELLVESGYYNEHDFD